MSDLPALYAVIRHGGSGVAPATPEPHEAKQIASYELVLGGASAGRVEFYVAAGAVSAPALTVADREVVEIADSCIAMLLADSVMRLAATVGPSSEIEEPAFEKPPGGNRSGGIVLVDELGRLTIREPANHFAGYEHSYAKGRVDPNETPQEAALRELTEETGLVGRIVGVVGDFAGQTGVTRFYVGIRTGGTEAPSDETWAVKTVTRSLR